MRIALIAMGMLVFAGCSAKYGDYYADSEYEYPGFGNATAQNESVHIVDPKPASAENTVIPASGKRGALAIERYETGKITKPESLRSGGEGGGGLMTQK